MKILILLFCLAFIRQDLWITYTEKQQTAIMQNLANIYGQKNHCTRVEISWEEKNGFIEFEATKCEVDI